MGAGWWWHCLRFAALGCAWIGLPVEHDQANYALLSSLCLRQCLILPVGFKGNGNDW